MHDIAWIDQSIVLFFNRFARRDPCIDKFIYDLGNSYTLKGGLFMAIYWWQWFRNDGDRAARRQSIVISVFGSLVAVLISRILQLGLPFHQRPLHTPSLHFVLPYGVDPATLSMWNSFPSDHAVLFFALAMGIWYLSRAVGALAMAWALVVICLPRIYLGFHYPSDVAAGAVIGLLLMMGTHALLRRGSLAARLMTWETAHRAAFYCAAFLVTYELAAMFYDLRELAVDGLQILRSVTTLASS